MSLNHHDPIMTHDWLLILVLGVPCIRLISLTLLLHQTWMIKSTKLTFSPPGRGRSLNDAVESRGSPRWEMVGKDHSNRVWLEKLRYQTLQVKIASVGFSFHKPYPYSFILGEYLHFGKCLVIFWTRKDTQIYIYIYIKSSKSPK